MKSRREFLSHTLTGTAAMSLAAPGLLADSTTGKPPMRFIFIHKGNGLLPESLIPPSFDKQQLETEKGKEAFSADLDEHDLPQWMSPLAEHTKNMTILQGLSGKMCTTGHHTWCSSLGAFKANERLSSIKWATVDFELAKLFPSPFEHIELACFPNGGGNARGNINGIEKGFSARGAQQPNYAFGSPKVAIQELFKSVSANETQRTRYELERRMLQFLATNETDLAEQLNGVERTKVGNYAAAIQGIRGRNRRVDAMSDVIRKHVPQLDEKYLAEDLSTIDRQFGLTEVLLSTLISGMTNVATFTVDELGTRYTGLSDLEGENINLHDVGHNKSIGGFEASEIREKVRRQHMTLIDRIVTRLKSVPEAGGSMFDNTMLFYFSDNGETHHSKGSEWPFIVLAGDNACLDISRRYIRLPGYGKPGHKTLGNWYTTLLNGYGNNINHYGALDVGLTIEQKGPIQQFLG
ncbi:MAG: DUF1552 domain-containing protein [Planctomycetaceae bacterium]|jgi:hypothetical protein|nr:DUF1552 domain-containing protein [Planctomycetaceae bacterium]MBT4724802.1 DUF1552 domain-containing protein [Planctomycetaceae bacterium]MBT4844709.1 DUF1552 domain-containing protein [Planctomycetaceae bacterium]MBT5124401.1 DUF1552 domain-containing protein [Planctomycetaceae bacterium]MBT5598464.1 DUF1552 domain-containing protein [Planctomycetaceae bacterium]